MNPEFLSDGLLYESAETWKLRFEKEGLSVCRAFSIATEGLCADCFALTDVTQFENQKADLAKEASTALESLVTKLPDVIFPTEAEKGLFLPALLVCMTCLERLRDRCGSFLSKALEEEKKWILLKTEVEKLQTSYATAKHVANEVFPLAIPALEETDASLAALVGKTKTGSEAMIRFTAKLPQWIRVLSIELPQKLSETGDLAHEGAGANPAKLYRVCGEAIHYFATV